MSGEGLNNDDVHVGEYGGDVRECGGDVGDVGEYGGDVVDLGDVGDTVRK